VNGAVPTTIIVAGLALAGYLIAMPFVPLAAVWG
jgi:hypothetical protein